MLGSHQGRLREEFGIPPWVYWFKMPCTEKWECEGAQCHTEKLHFILGHIVGWDGNGDTFYRVLCLTEWLWDFKNVSVLISETGSLGEHQKQETIFLIIGRKWNFLQKRFIFCSSPDLCLFLLKSQNKSKLWKCCVMTYWDWQLCFLCSNQHNSAAKIKQNEAGRGCLFFLI